VPGLDEVVLSALRPDPRRRCANAIELLEQWQAVWQAGPARKSSVIDPSSGSRLTRPKRWITAAVLLVAFSGFYAFNNASQSPDISSVAAPVHETAICRVDPPDSRAVLIPVDERGLPRLDAVIQPTDSGQGELKFSGLAVGWYLLEAARDGHGFIQVYRRVPAAGELSGQFRHLYWDINPDSIGWIDLKIVEVPASPPSMALFPEDEVSKNFEPFWLDTREVTRGEVAAVLKPSNLPPPPYGQPDDPAYAARLIAYDVALAYAEKVGKRLPTELEFECAATNSWRTRFPWGNERIEGKDAWDFGGPAGTPEYDQTNTDPPCFGLLSNIAEWTSTIGDTSRAPERIFRIVRGCPYDVLEGRQPSRLQDVDPLSRQLIDSGSMQKDRYPHLGFRCARSTKPLVLKYEP